MWGILSRRLQAPKADPRTGVNSWHRAPGYGHCLRCRTAWKFVEDHSTYFQAGSGCFPLCQLCWSELTPTARLPFYYVLWRQWEWDADREGRDLFEQWDQIERAVLNEDAAPVASDEAGAN